MEEIEVRVLNKETKKKAQLCVSYKWNIVDNGKKKKEKKILMLSIDCSVVLFYNFNDDSTTHFATIQYGKQYRKHCEFM